jgi:uncharacterized repeat protein (TIGR02543 family)
MRLAPENVDVSLWATLTIAEISYTNYTDADYRTVSAQQNANATVTIDQNNVYVGKTASFTVAASTHYNVTKVSAKCGETAVELTAGENGAYSFVMPDGNVEIVVETVPVNYTVTFDVAGGSAVAAQTVPYGTSASALENFSSEKAGYTFAGWTLADGSAIPEGAVVESDITVKAAWTIIEYTVTFKNGDEVIGTATYTVENKQISEPAVPAKENYTGAWESYELTTGDVVVNVQYTPIEYTVTFKADGKVVATETYTVEDKDITVPAVPEKEGYTGVWESYELTTGDVVVNAQYTEIVVDNPPVENPSVDDNTVSTLFGCAGSVSGLSVGVMALGVAVLFAKKKKED